MRGHIWNSPFEERRLNTLRENQICQKVNQNVNQERAARPHVRPPAAHPDTINLMTGFFPPKTWLKMQTLVWVYMYMKWIHSIHITKALTHKAPPIIQGFH